jgi:hypothetical protein
MEIDLSPFESDHFPATPAGQAHEPYQRLQEWREMPAQRLELIRLKESRPCVDLSFSIGIDGRYASFPASIASENIRFKTFSSLLISAFDTERLFSPRSPSR